MSFYVTNKIMILLLMMMMLPPIVWGHDSSPAFWRSRNLGNGVCPDGRAPESVLYEFELFVLHESTMCSDEQKDQVDNKLNQLLDEVLQTVPDMISAETSLCPVDSDQTNRRTTSIDDRGMFIYRGNARCRHCSRDNSDNRRYLVNRKQQQCKHGWTNIFRTTNKRHRWNGWVNVKQFPSLDHCGQETDVCLGPYKSGETLSKIITVPQKTIVMKVILVVQHDGAPWKYGDWINFRLGKDLLVQVPIRPIHVVHRLKSKEYSVIVKHIWSQDGKSIDYTLVRLHFHTLNIFSEPNRAHRIKLAISTKLTSSRGKQKKVAFFKRLNIVVAQTCGRILPSGSDRKKRDEIIQQWELREFLEALLSFRMTYRFRVWTQSKNHCFEGTNPHIFLHMKEIKDNGAPLECGA